MIDSQMLSRHCVVVGQTGSGKTSLAIAMLESLAANKVPLVIFDVKGDFSAMPLSHHSDLVPGDLSKKHQIDFSKNRTQEDWELLSKSNRDTTFKLIKVKNYGNAFNFTGHSSDSSQNNADTFNDWLRAAHAVMPEMKSIELVREDNHPSYFKRYLNRASNFNPDIFANNWVSGQEIIVPAPGEVVIYNLVQASIATRRQFIGHMCRYLLNHYRSMGGSDTARCGLVLDEAHAYIPAVGEPFGKADILSVFREGRAYGLGMITITQNLTDLAYKLMSNASTWYIGRLNSPRESGLIQEMFGCWSQVSALKPRNFVRIQDGEQSLYQSPVHYTIPLGPIDIRKIVLGWPGYVAISNDYVYVCKETGVISDTSSMIEFKNKLAEYYRKNPSGIHPQAMTAVKNIHSIKKKAAAIVSKIKVLDNKRAAKTGTGILGAIQSFFSLSSGKTTGVRSTINDTTTVLNYNEQIKQLSKELDSLEEEKKVAESILAKFIHLVDEQVETMVLAASQIFY